MNTIQKNIVTCIMILLFITTTGYAKEIKGKQAGDAKDTISSTFKFDSDNLDRKLTTKDGKNITYEMVAAVYGSDNGMRIYTKGVDICSSEYAYKKKPVGMDLSDKAGWPNIRIKPGEVAIDPVSGRLRFSDGDDDPMKTISTYSGTGEIYGILRKGDILYTANFKSGLEIMNVSPILK